jgi:hypothetical protein
MELKKFKEFVFEGKFDKYNIEELEAMLTHHKDDLKELKDKGEECESKEEIEAEIKEIEAIIKKLK